MRKGRDRRCDVTVEVGHEEGRKSKEVIDISRRQAVHPVSWKINIFYVLPIEVFAAVGYIHSKVS